MICRELAESKIVEVKGGEFTIGFISRRKFKEISAKMAQCQSYFGDKGITEKALKKLDSDSVRQSTETMTELYWDLVKYGVRGHSKLEKADGTQIPYKQEKDGYGACVSEETISIYDLNGFLIPLGTEILDFNVLKDDDKKN